MRTYSSDRNQARPHSAKPPPRTRGFTLGVLCLALFGAPESRAAEAPTKRPEELVTAAAQAFESGRKDECFKLLKAALDTAPANPQIYFVRGRFYSLDHQSEPAIADFTQVIRLNPTAALAYQYRGEEQFKLGRINESITDFDHYLELNPDARPQHWQRGISLYYAKRYDEARRQFELHQTVNTSDVENAAWHFLCVARASDPVKARMSLIKIDGDGRIPMMQVYELFAGKGSPEAVIAAAKAGNPSSRELQQRLFFAHLYLGLYHEAMGNRDLAQTHIFKAADEFRQEHYMGDVARVHAEILRKGAAPATAPSTQRTTP